MNFKSISTNTLTPYSSGLFVKSLSFNQITGNPYVRFLKSVHIRKISFWEHVKSFLIDINEFFSGNKGTINDINIEKHIENPYFKYGRTQKFKNNKYFP